MSGGKAPLEPRWRLGITWANCMVPLTNSLQWSVGIKTSQLRVTNKISPHKRVHRTPSMARFHRFSIPDSRFLFSLSLSSGKPLLKLYGGPSENKLGFDWWWGQRWHYFCVELWSYFRMAISPPRDGWMDGCREYREGRLIGKNVKKKKEKEKGKEKNFGALSALGL